MADLLTQLTNDATIIAALAATIIFPVAGWIKYTISQFKADMNQLSTTQRNQTEKLNQITDDVAQLTKRQDQSQTAHDLIQKTMNDLDVRIESVDAKLDVILSFVQPK